VRLVRVDGGVNFQSDVDRLPGTSENLARLALVPPPGFVQMS